jgi:hypothetical protein
MKICFGKLTWSKYSDGVEEGGIAAQKMDTFVLYLPRRKQNWESGPWELDKKAEEIPQLSWRCKEGRWWRSLDLGLRKLDLRIVSRPRSPLVLPGSRMFKTSSSKKG